jgi:hypothetical protein
VTYQPSSQPLDAAALREFASTFTAGTLKPTVKSEEAPADNSAPVKVVVGTTFADIVLNSEKDVLLEQYAVRALSLSLSLAICHVCCFCC